MIRLQDGAGKRITFVDLLTDGPIDGNRGLVARYLPGMATTTASSTMRHRENTAKAGYSIH